MPTTMPTRSAGSSPSPSSKRSLLSRLKAPFGPKARHVAEYYIQPDDPHRQYGPGDVITGSVVLKIIKAISVTHITVCLHGHAQVYKTPNTAGEGLKQYNASLAAGKTKKSGGYYGNGFVSLFEDEIVLCGEGRLGEGTYQFNYELMFPKKSLPSSIDFERGTISYNVTSTMTRPTTISPISSCTRKVNFQEDIDVAALAAPKPRVISLEPIHRRTKPKRTKKTAVGAEKRSSESEGPTLEPGVNNRVADINGSQADSEPPHSPVPSDVSFDSILSGSVGTGSAIDSGAPSTTQTGETRTTSRKAITATIEVQKAGFLSGETIPIKIMVAHTKQITSLRGVIVTLYRQARVDMHPALPVVTGGEDEVYPRSRTGLSGLSLSSAGSTHLFRKDLDQGFAALMVNPETLTAEIKATLRVPEEAFPSIASVPGAMISFKYYVEVVLDIQGKLAGLDRMLPSSVGTMTGLSNARPTDSSVYAPWGGHFMSTEEIRRDKSVISSLFEVVVGTRDSAKKSAWKHSVREGGLQGPADTGPEMTTDDIPSYAHSEGHHQNVGQQLHPVSAWDSQYGYPTDDAYYEEPPVARFPLPDLQEQSEPVSEKEQLRRAEARLLPSAPPEAGVESSATAAAHAPSAPALPDEAAHALLPSAPFQHDVVIAGPSSPRQTRQSRRESSAPAYDHHSAPSAPPTEDKQELHRRNLEMERSAPEDLPEELEAEVGVSAPAPPHMHEPTAPILTEDDEFLFNVPASHQLPSSLAMSPKEFPFPKGEDASTNSSSPPEAFYRQPVQPVPLITHIPDPQQSVPVVYNPEPPPQPQQTVPAYRPESRQQYRAQPQQSTPPASRSASRQLPRGARQQSFVTAYSPASRQQQYLPDALPATRTPSPTRQQHQQPEAQQAVRDFSLEPQRQSIPTYRPESRRQRRRGDPGQRARDGSPDPPRAGQTSMRTPMYALDSNFFGQTASANVERRFFETERRPVETTRRPVGTERRPIETQQQPVETERHPVETERRSTDTVRRSTATAHRRTDSVQHEKDTEHQVPAPTPKTNTTVSPAPGNPQPTRPKHNPTSPSATPTTPPR
ncbi:hypothetical protein BLS_009177 [Venturia inaequalis]|uniref:Arrestin C-terminal-like domain-containing protein n=1 Tax=Venturia inaequalis TaxID=5025 RepID=A0A8H3U623_VENIN|nr:hypothetical protein BLS_009177 [Venturia inaequalis]